MSTRAILTYALVFIVIFSVGGLAGWYYYLQKQQHDMARVSQGRGLGHDEPTAHQTGSTYGNIAQTVGGAGQTHGEAGTVGGGADTAAGTNGGGTNTNEGTNSGGFTQGDSALGAPWGSVGGATLGTLAQSGFMSGTSSIAGVGGGASGANTGTNPAAPQLWHAVRNPVAGYGFIGTGTSTMLYFAERATGYVFSLDLQGESTLRRTNTLTPKTYEALFAADGSVIERSLTDNGIKTVAAIIGTTTGGTTASLVGTPLETNIDSIALNPVTKQIAYTREDADGTALYVMEWNGAKKTKLFTSTVGSWRVMFVGGRIILASKPSDSLAGYAYEVKSNGTLATIARAAPSLAVLPRPDAGALLYSSSGALMATTEGSTTAQAINLRTFADKCVWAPSAGTTKKATHVAYCAIPDASATLSVDAWYQGRAHTSDQWWSVNLDDGTTKALSGANDALQDVQDPLIDPSGTYIAYKDARDQSLWIMRLNH